MVLCAMEYIALVEIRKLEALVVESYERGGEIIVVEVLYSFTKLLEEGSIGVNRG